MNPDLESVFNAVLDANGGNGKELLSLQVKRKSKSRIQLPGPDA